MNVLLVNAKKNQNEFQLSFGQKFDGDRIETKHFMAVEEETEKENPNFKSNNFHVFTL